MELRYYQNEAVDSLFDYFLTHGGTGSDGKPIRANPLICLPTGTGKSLVIGEFVRRAMQMHPGTRIFMATHVKELIKQNANKMREIWPLAPLGVYSAGLGVRDTMQPITFGGVQSCVGKFPMFGRRDLLIIDEAHLVSPTADTSYVKFINELMYGTKGADPNSGNVNPYLKVIGLTATAYRLGLGCMTNGPIFTDIAYNLCTVDGFNRLIAEGFLCPLIPKRTATELDVSNVGMSKGEYAQGELQAAVDQETVTYAALTELVAAGFDRKSWLIFASGVEHAEHIAEMLNNIFGIPTVCIHSKKTNAENDKALADWKSGKARAAVNMNSLTTGVDHPACDLIGMLRPTMSTGLWVQMLGRGTRPFPDKSNCLVLDFAGNTRRLGPINDPVIPKQKGKGPPGDAPVKICEVCGTYNHASARVCIACGEEFTFQEKLNRHAAGLELIRSDLPQIETYKVDRVVMVAHTSKNSGRDSIKVAYFCGLRTFFEYISVESNVRFFKHKSRDWFRQRYHYQTEQFTWESDCPNTNAEVLAIAHELRQPQTINVWVNKQTPEIMGYGF
jgi:DNA repair protein RadD